MKMGMTVAVEVRQNQALGIGGLKELKYQIGRKC